MPNIILLDIDETLIFGTRMLNQNLINALKKKKLTEVYLFSNMGLRDISTALQAKDPSSGLRAEDVHMPRAELIYLLNQQGIQVKEVIIPADPVYAQGSGAVYRDFHEPLSRRAFPEFFSASDVSLTPLVHNAYEDEDFKEKFDEFSKLYEIAQEDNHNKHGAAGSKRNMFRYFMHDLSSKNLIHLDAPTNIILFDDRSHLLEGVKEEANELQSDFPKLKLHTFQVSESSSESDYSKFLDRSLCSKQPAKLVTLFKQNANEKDKRQLNLTYPAIAATASCIISSIALGLLYTGAISTSAGPYVWPASIALLALGGVLFAGVAAVKVSRSSCFNFASSYESCAETVKDSPATFNFK